MDRERNEWIGCCMIAVRIHQCSITGIHTTAQTLDMVRGGERPRVEDSCPNKLVVRCSASRHPTSSPRAPANSMSTSSHAS